MKKYRLEKVTQLTALQILLILHKLIALLRGGGGGQKVGRFSTNSAKSAKALPAARLRHLGR